MFSGDVSNGEPSTSRTDVHDETDFSMASLTKREVTQVCVSLFPPREIIKSGILFLKGC